MHKHIYESQYMYLLLEYYILHRHRHSCAYANVTSVHAIIKDKASTCMYNWLEHEKDMKQNRFLLFKSKLTQKNYACSLSLNLTEIQTHNFWIMNRTFPATDTLTH